MSRVPWHTIQDRQLRAHLVVGAIVQPDGPSGEGDLTAAHAVLRRLVTKQEPAADYAATLVRDTGRPEVHFAFRDEGDARKFAAAVKARSIGSHPGWASQRSFQLDGAKVTALAASLPAPKTRPKRLPEVD
jgi:hypothetical protein